jgi:type I site-specific restriction-modification system R (restriction) subunit
MTLDESNVEAAALDWLGELGYAVRHGRDLAPGEPATEWDSFGDVVLVGRLRNAIQRINPNIPHDAREDALRKVLRVSDWAFCPALAEDPQPDMSDLQYLHDRDTNHDTMSR